LGAKRTHGPQGFFGRGIDEKTKQKSKLQKVDRWANAMMKQQADDNGNIVGYTFNNTRENVEATFHVLCRLADFTPPPPDKKQDFTRSWPTKRQRLRKPQRCVTKGAP
jgi:hypothetical protein